MHTPPNFIEKPLKLVSFDSLGHAIVHQEALSFIQSLDKPISILCVAGPFRTGKSFFLNQLIGLEKQSLFEVGQKTQACTKGIWIWGKPLLTVNNEGEISNVLLIDTEGFGAIHEENDQKVITLALLLSTVFVYNSKGVIDRDTISQFENIITIASELKKENHWQTDFHWVLRDFQFQLTNEMGSRITSDQYMEKSFSEFSEHSPNTIKSLSSYFRSRFCHTFVSPKDESNEEKPEFTEQILRFKKIFTSFPSIKFDGDMVSQILEAYINGINNKFNICQIYNLGKQCQIRRQCLQKLHSKFSKISSKSNQSLYKVQKEIQQIEAEIKVMYEERIPNSDEESFKEFLIEMKEISQEFVKRIQREPTKNHKRISRQSIKVSKKQIRLSLAAINDLESQKLLRSEQRIQSMGFLKIREELEGKVHRYELEIKQLKEENQRLVQSLSTTQIERDQSLDALQELQEEEFFKSKSSINEMLQLKEEKEKLREQKLMLESQLTTQRELYHRKINFLEGQMATYEIHQKDSEQGLIKKYKSEIDFLQKQNDEMLDKHQMEINFIKNLFKQCAIGTEEEWDGQSLQISEKMKQQVEKTFETISKLKDTNYRYQLLINQRQSDILKLQQENDNLKIHYSIQLESQDKRHKESEIHLKQISRSQIEAKDKIIFEITEKIDQISRQKLSSDQFYQEKCSRFEDQILQINNQLSEKIDQFKKDIHEYEKKIQTLEEILEEKQKEKQNYYYDLTQFRQKIIEQQGSKAHYQSEKEEFTRKIKELKDEHSEELQKLQRIIESLNSEINENEAEYKKKLESESNENEILKMRSQQKILNLKAALSHHQKLQFENQRVKQEYESLLQQYKELGEELEEKGKKMIQIENQNKILLEQNEKLDRIIHQLNKRLDQNQVQLREMIGQNSNDKILRENKYYKLLENYHTMQKEHCVLKEMKNGVQKRLEEKQKENGILQSRLSDKNIEQMKQKQKNYEKFEIKDRQLKKKEQQIELLKQKNEHLLDIVKRNTECLTQERQKDTKKNDYIVTELLQKIRKMENSCENHLQKIKRLEMDARETTFSIIEMNKNYKKHYDQYENNARLLRKRIRELDEENKRLKDQFNEVLNQLRRVQESKSLIEDNYSADFRLWSGKIKTYEDNIQKMLK